MFDDPFYNISHGEVYQKSMCMTHEHILANFFSSMLMNLGYTTIDPARRSWVRSAHKVVVCLSDDFIICSENRTQPMSKIFDSSTTIITDNQIQFDTEYKVFTLPCSYFGVFNYQPDLQIFNPTHRFGFCVNRLDSQRELIFLEMIQSSGGLNNVLNQDLINFNAWDAAGSNNSAEDIKFNFFKYWKQIENSVGLQYRDQIVELIDHLPVKNHNLSVEQVHVHSWLNLVVETYAGNSTIAFSEKIFRALVTPAPWMLYGAKNAIAHLRFIGFDVLDDILCHDYDADNHDSPCNQQKIKSFVNSSLTNYNKLRSFDFNTVKISCTRAANHNQLLLQKLQKNWPFEFAKVLPSILEHVAGK